MKSSLFAICYSHYTNKGIDRETKLSILKKLCRGQDNVEMGNGSRVMEVNLLTMIASAKLS